MIKKFDVFVGVPILGFPDLKKGDMTKLYFYLSSSTNKFATNISTRRATLNALKSQIV